MPAKEKAAHFGKIVVDTLATEAVFKGAKIAFSGLCAGGKSIAQAIPKAGETAEIAAAGTEGVFKTTIKNPGVAETCEKIAANPPKMEIVKEAKITSQFVEKTTKNLAKLFPKVEDLKMSQTVENHMHDIIKKGSLKGEAARPYIDSNGTRLLLNEIMQADKPIKDLYLKKWFKMGY